MTGQDPRPRSPDCRDVNCHKCPGQAWDLEADQEVDCRCDCHPPRRDDRAAMEGLKFN